MNLVPLLTEKDPEKVRDIITGYARFFSSPLPASVLVDAKADVTQPKALAAMAGITTVNAHGFPQRSLIPIDFHLGVGRGIGEIWFHIPNTNAQLQDLKNRRPLFVDLASIGQDISPSWFADRNRASTHANLNVQCRGTVELFDSLDDKRAILDRQVALREAPLKNPWSAAELQDDGYERRLKMLTMVKVAVTEATVVARLLQDESPNNVRSVLAVLRHQPMDAHHGRIADMIEMANAARLGAPALSS